MKSIRNCLWAANKEEEEEEDEEMGMESDLEGKDPEKGNINCWLRACAVAGLRGRGKFWGGQKDGGIEKSDAMLEKSVAERL